MKSLVEFINEVLDPKKYGPNNKFTVGGTIDDRILLFDIDDTLLHSNARIEIVDKKTREHIKWLSNETFNSYSLKPGEDFNYAEFRSLEGLLNSVMLPYWKTLKREYQKGTHIAILTARGAIDMIKKFFLMKGIDIKDDLIFATGDPRMGFKEVDKAGDIAKNKAICVERLYEVGYKTFVFFDDNDKNLEDVKKLEKKLPIKVHTVKA